MASTGFVGGMTGGVLDIYSGAIPADADAAEGAGVKLLRITVDHGAFPANALHFEPVATAGVAEKETTETWQGLGLDDGTAAWFRFYDSNDTPGASGTALRFDGTVGTSGADLLLTSTNIVNGATTTLDTAEFTLPASA
jgi:hypothetical protein